MISQKKYQELRQAYKDLLEDNDKLMQDNIRLRLQIAEQKNGMISRAELFNKLATIHAPMEANEYKAEVYKVIQSL